MATAGDRAEDPRTNEGRHTMGNGEGLSLEERITRLEDVEAIKQPGESPAALDR